MALTLCVTMNILSVIALRLIKPLPIFIYRDVRIEQRVEMT